MNTACNFPLNDRSPKLNHNLVRVYLIFLMSKLTGDVVDIGAETGSSKGEGVGQGVDGTSGSSINEATASSGIRAHIRVGTESLSLEVVNDLSLETSITSKSGNIVELTSALLTTPGLGSRGFAAAVKGVAGNSNNVLRLWRISHYEFSTNESDKVIYSQRQEP